MDPTDDSSPPQGMARDPDEQEELAASRREGERLVDFLIRKNRLLHDDERPIAAVRKHPAALAWNVFLTLGVLWAAVMVSTYVRDKVVKNGNVTFSITLFQHVEKVTGNKDIVIISLWLVYGLTLYYLVYKVIAWNFSYLVITNKQIILIAGQPLFWLRFASVRISQVTSWYLRESFGGNTLGYKSLVVKSGDHDEIVRTIGHVPGIVVGSIEEALPSEARYAGDEEAFTQWNAGGLRRRVRLVIAVLLICLLVVLAVAAAINPRFRTALANQAEIIALLPILIVLITPKSWVITHGSRMLNEG